MLSFIRPVAAAALLAGLTILESSHGAPTRGEASVTRLPPDTNIAEQVARNEGRGGDVTYKIEGLYVTGEGNQRGPEIKLDLFETSALGEDTTYSVYGGESKPVGRRGNHILVSDAAKSDTFAVLTVNVESGTTSGILQESQGKPVSVSQGRGTSAAAREADDFTPPAWECGADKTVRSEENDVNVDEAERRGLLGGDDHIHHHDHGHDEHHHHGSDILAEGFDGIKSALRGGKIQEGRRLYLTDTYPQRYSYQVDMYIEIDQAFVDQQGSLEAAFDYVDVLVSGANIIYEHEIDTHLHVAHIALTDHYDGETNTGDALDRMVALYQGSSWHYTTGSGIDLHHALLGNSLGGGIAYIGVLCNSWWGYGLSASLSGNFVSLDAATVWDMKVFAHELGHNFNSRHTHDSAQYSPAVDTCGLFDANGNRMCPADLQNGATIMSYCHQCSGGYSNILYTFGGDWQGPEGSNRLDVNTWENNEELQGTASSTPRRVPLEMYKHVVASGSCLNPTHAVPLQVCSADAECDDGHVCNGQETCDTLNSQCVPGTKLDCVDGDACTYDLCNDSGCYHPPVDCDDGNPCTIDTCDTIEGCKHEMQYPCCGNGVCEASASEDMTSCQADCGPFTIDAPLCSSCWISDGNIFDVEAVDDIKIDGVTFYSYQGSGTVEVWTRPGSYAGFQYSDVGWTKVATKTLAGTDTWVLVETPITPVLMSAGSTQAFYVTHTGGNHLLYTNNVPEGSVITDDGRMRILAGRWSHYPFAGGNTGAAWGGSLHYEFDAPACTVAADCDDGVFCNGAEVCDSGTCVAGDAVSCDDGVSCTTDSCNVGTDSCDHIPNDSVCDNGLFCDGVETCDALQDCQDGTAPTCAHGCDESTDSCFDCSVDADCDDGDFCDGSEVCNAKRCQEGNPPTCAFGCNEGTDSCNECSLDADCDDGSYCNGAETCSAGTCVSGTAPDCPHGCDESTDSCVECTVSDDCDNGDFCDGPETCLGGVCVAGADPCPAGCDEAADMCVDCVIDADCDDGNYCNGAETCSGGACVDGTAPVCSHGCDEATDSCFDCSLDSDCDNGAFCDGPETCNSGRCASGAAPTCADGCNEATDSCNECSEDVDCDDGNYCNGAETCSAGTCVDGTAPVCAHGCDEATDSCFECAVDGDCDNGLFCDGTETCVNNACVAGSAVNCDDGVACTVDSCNEGTDSCDHTANDSLCDNGLFCDGTETCDAVLGCQSGTPVSCDDGVGCTDDSCSESNGGQCEYVPNNANCNSGEVCDGQACVVNAGWTTILSNDFESGWQDFNDGGSDAARRADGTGWVHSGLYALRIRDGATDSSAVVESDPLDTTNYSNFKVSFWFRGRGVESGEAFSLEVSACDGSWNMVKRWQRGIDWTSNAVWHGVGDDLDLAAEEFATLGVCTDIRFRMEANQNNDRIYIDDVVVEAN